MYSNPVSFLSIAAMPVSRSSRTGISQSHTHTCAFQDSVRADVKEPECKRRRLEGQSVGDLQPASGFAGGGAGVATSFFLQAEPPVSFVPGKPSQPLTAASRGGRPHHRVARRDVQQSRNPSRLDQYAPLPVPEFHDSRRELPGGAGIESLFAESGNALASAGGFKTPFVRSTNRPGLWTVADSADARNEAAEKFLEDLFYTDRQSGADQPIAVPSAADIRAAFAEPPAAAEFVATANPPSTP